MKNAFDPAEETERDWDIELRDDVKGEVEDKYGKVAEIFVVKDSQVSTTNGCIRLAVRVGS
jgi:RNA-binding protein 39